MNMPKKQLASEALIDLHQRLSVLPSRSHERRMIMQETAQPIWGDDTKVRKLSGSRSYGDARSLNNSSWNTIFKVPEGGEGDNLQKSSVSRSKSDNQAAIAESAITILHYAGLKLSEAKFVFWCHFCELFGVKFCAIFGIKKVPFHSIIGNRGIDEGANSSDGIVAYRSSHLKGAKSEKIVPAGHNLVLSEQIRAAFRSLRCSWPVALDSGLGNGKVMLIDSPSEKSLQARGWVEGLLVVKLITDEENEHDRVRC
jgi:hypothetical protein